MNCLEECSQPIPGRHETTLLNTSFVMLQVIPLFNLFNREGYKRKWTIFCHLCRVSHPAALILLPVDVWQKDHIYKKSLSIQNHKRGEES